MREIKFRAWDNKPDQKMWIDHFSTGGAGINDQGELYRHDKNIIVEQYTGLLDKSGVEIYEGDIIGYFEEIYLVRWFNYNEDLYKDVRTSTNYPYMAPGVGFGFEPLKNTEWDHKDFKLCYFSERFAVIGNIHENPELLK